MTTQAQPAPQLPPPTLTIAATAMRHARQFVCGLRGHDVLLHFEEHRMSLQCPSCGYESPGWDVHARQGHRLRRSA